jgi:hypothetical protein
MQQAWPDREPGIHRSHDRRRRIPVTTASKREGCANRMALPFFLGQPPKK